MKKILFINFGGLGDDILFLPSVISVRKNFPDAKITLVVEKRGKSIEDLTNVVDEIIVADVKNKNKYFELFKLLLKIWKRRFDTVISSGSNKFISVFLFSTFINKRYGYNSGKFSEILLTKAIKLNKNQYAVNMYHDLVQEITSIKTNLPILDIKKKEKLLNTILIHPGVSALSVKNNMIKTITPELWAEVTERLSDLGKRVLLVGGPDDKEVIETIQKLVSQEKYENYYGKTQNIKDLAELISSAEIFLCSDSAPLHIAVAVGTKTYVIFGSTDEKKLIPQNENVIPIKKDNCNCKLRPCLWEKRKTTCEKLECLDFTVDEIINQIITK